MTTITQITVTHLDGTTKTYTGRGEVTVIHTHRQSDGYNPKGPHEDHVEAHLLLGDSDG